MPFAKHIHVLQILSTVPDVQQNRESPMTPAEAETLWDQLFTYIHANWAEPATAAVDGVMKWSSFTAAEKVEISDCGKMLAMSYKELEEKLNALPPYFAEYVFPVSVARYLLMRSGNKALPLNHRNLTTFKEFYRRYGTMILSDC
jgi:hypothetical protein